MDTYSGYNQIPIHPAYEENNSFITNIDLYYYKVMLICWKTLRLPTRDLLKKCLAVIDKTMKVYVDDMLWKA